MCIRDRPCEDFESHSRQCKAKHGTDQRSSRDHARVRAFTERVESREKDVGNASVFGERLLENRHEDAVDEFDFGRVDANCSSFHQRKRRQEKDDARVSKDWI